LASLVFNTKKAGRYDFYHSSFGALGFEEIGRPLVR
jgi:hypothetical protein